MIEVEPRYCPRCDELRSHARGQCVICLRARERGPEGMISLGLGLLVVMWLSVSPFLPHLELTPMAVVEVGAFFSRGPMALLGVLAIIHGARLLLRSARHGD